VVWPKRRQRSERGTEPDGNLRKSPRGRGGVCLGGGGGRFIKGVAKSSIRKKKVAYLGTGG